MSLVPSGSYTHKIQYIGRDWYRLSWSVYVKMGRLLGRRRYHRDTDLIGAQRFAKKWGTSVPAPPQGQST